MKALIYKIAGTLFSTVGYFILAILILVAWLTEWYVGMSIFITLFAAPFLYAGFRFHRRGKAAALEADQELVRELVLFAEKEMNHSLTVLKVSQHLERHTDDVLKAVQYLLRHQLVRERQTLWNGNVVNVYFFPEFLSLDEKLAARPLGLLEVSSIAGGTIVSPGMLNQALHEGDILNLAALHHGCLTASEILCRLPISHRDFLELKNYFIAHKLAVEHMVMKDTELVTVYYFPQFLPNEALASARQRDVESLRLQQKLRE